MSSITSAPDNSKKQFNWIYNLTPVIWIVIAACVGLSIVIVHKDIYGRADVADLEALANVCPDAKFNRNELEAMSSYDTRQAQKQCRRNALIGKLSAKQ